MDNTVDSSFADPDKYKLQAKNIFKELSLNPPSRLLTISSGEYSFHLLTDQGVSYLTLCESKAPSYLAFSFLEDLHKEFQTLYGTELGKTERPYAFIKFDTFLQKTKKVYSHHDTIPNESHVFVPCTQTTAGVGVKLDFCTAATVGEDSGTGNDLPAFGLTSLLNQNA